MQVDINNDVNYLNNHVNSKTSTTEEDEEEFEFEHQPLAPLSDSETPPIDWDSDENW